MINKKISFLLISGVLILVIVLVAFVFPKGKSLKIKKEFEIQGLTWRTFSYYYNDSIYQQGYNWLANWRFLRKAKKAGGNFLLVRAFYNGNDQGGLVGNEEKAKKVLKGAIEQAHKAGFKILLVPYVESREYWVNKKWWLSKDVWTKTVLKWAKFAQENNVEMFAPGVEMNIILNESEVGEWFKEILPKIREVYFGIVTTAEHYDVEKWKILDEAQAFAGYDCLGFTFFPRKEYNGVSDIRSFDDYKEYVEKEAKVIDMLSEKYHIQCKLAVPMGLDYWKESHLKKPVPDAEIVAQATSFGLDILKKHNFTGVFISHWASEPDHFGKNTAVEEMLQKRWTLAE